MSNYDGVLSDGKEGRSTTFKSNLINSRKNNSYRANILRWIVLLDKISFIY